MFCSHDSRETQTYENLVGCMLRQIVEISGRQLSGAVKSFCESAQQNIGGAHKGQPKHEHMLAALAGEFRTFGRVFIIVDGLDECAEDVRSRLLSCLSTLLDDQQVCVSILITARPGFKPEAQSQWPEIEISASDADVRAFLEQKIDENERLRKFKQGNLIQEKITERAQGM